MTKFIHTSVFLLAALLFSIDLVQAQQSQLFRQSDGMIRIAVTGQIADTVSVWGDIGVSGRYLIPRGTRMHEMLAYAGGPGGAFRAGQETEIGWSRVRLNVNISRYDPVNSREVVQNFRFHYNDPFPEDLRNYTLRNDDIISMEVRRRPIFTDYLRVIGPILSTAAATIILIDRL